MTLSFYSFTVENPDRAQIMYTFLGRTKLLPGLNFRRVGMVHLRTVYLSILAIRLR